MKKKLPNTEENFNTFTNTVPNLEKEPKRQLEDELFKKNWQKTVVDTFEKNLGLPDKTTTQTKKNVLIKNKTFQLEFDKDQILLNELMNSPRYHIILWKDTWTMDGNYRIFAIYEDNLDYNPDKK